MAKKRTTTEVKLARIAELEEAPLSSGVIRELSAALASSNSFLAAKAARVVAHRELTDLIPALVEAFDLFMSKSDKGCTAKTAIVEALDQLDHRGEDVFQRGMRHVQMEPVFGGHVDTAAELRGKSGMAMARMDHPEASFLLLPLLMDPELQTRIAAVRALGYLGRRENELLLRMKALAGDSESEVLAECFSALMRLDPERSMDFVAAFIGSRDPLIAEDAAIAVGESHQERAFDVLHHYWKESLSSRFKEMLFLPMALTRLDGAFDFLIGVIESDHPANAAAAVKALKIYAGNEQRRARVREAVLSRDNPVVSLAFKDFD